jgi:hypothetical protein
MKNLIATALVLAAASIASSSASAQSGRALATIPFNFSAGEHTAPAGTYILSRLNENVIGIDGTTTNVHLMALASSSAADSQRSRLVFHKYGNQYFLSEIRCSGSVGSMHLSKTKAEKLAKTQRMEAGLRMDETVTVALGE